MSITGVEETSILISDLEDIRQVIAACLTYFTAQDVAKAQMAFGKMRSSALTQELERTKERIDGIFGDFLLNRYEEEKSGKIDSIVEDLEDESDSEDEISLLSLNPLGSFKSPRQEGRRIEPPTIEVEESEAEESG